MLRVPHVSFSMPCAGAPFEFVRPADPESILDAMTDEEYEKDKLLPYWAEQWPASFALFNFMAAHSGTALPPSALVCELGCGLGIVSSVLVNREVRCVATDIALDACRFTRHNMLLHARGAHVVCTDWRHVCFPPSSTASSRRTSFTNSGGWNQFSAFFAVHSGPQALPMSLTRAGNGGIPLRSLPVPQDSVRGFRGKNA